MNFSRSYDWLNDGARVKTSKIWAPVCWQPVVLRVSKRGPLGLQFSEVSKRLKTTNF